MFLKLSTIFLLTCLLINVNHAFSSQFAGGELRYQCIRSAATENDFEVTLIIYRNAKSFAEFSQPVIWILNNASPGPFSRTFKLEPALKTRAPLNSSQISGCYVNSPLQEVEKFEFTGTITLPVSANGYTLLFTSCCRDKPSANLIPASWNIGIEIIGGAPEDGQSLTYHTTIPPQILYPKNSSPVAPDSLIPSCAGVPVNYRLNYSDPDGDSLSFAWSSPAGKINPPSVLLSYIDFKDEFYAFPLGGVPKINLDPVTGLISGTPDVPGKFTVAIDIFEYRNGKLMNIHKKDFQIVVTQCRASIPSLPVNCESPAVSILNHSNSEDISYLWDFGVDGITTDTSTKVYPYYTYPKGGDYTITLIAKSTSGCTDTAKTIARVYPGLKASFKWDDPICNGELMKLQNTSEFPWGTITGYVWKNITSRGVSVFSREPDAVFPYKAVNSRENPFSIELTISTNVGCSATLLQAPVVYPMPVANAGPDTLLGFNTPYTMPVKPEANFKYLWQPAAGLNNAKLANPILVSDKNQTYVLKVSGSNERCFSYDTVTIKYAKGPELYVPTAFTPNGDGLNDGISFTAVHLQVQQFIIYNRYGQEVYVYKKEKPFWDGYIKGILQDAGTYYWAAKGTASGNRAYVKRGFFVMIK